MPQPKHLAAGQRRAAVARKRERIRRVRAFEAWLKAGSPARKIPEIPSNDDYKAARAAGAVKR